jgi:hypothetical protein
MYAECATVTHNNKSMFGDKKDMCVPCHREWWHADGIDGVVPHQQHSTNTLPLIFLIALWNTQLIIFVYLGRYFLAISFLDQETYDICELYVVLHGLYMSELSLLSLT